MDGCYYIGYGAQAFGWTQLFPSIVGICFFVITAATKQPFFVIFSTFLYVPQFILWVLQSYFAAVMPDPVCQLYHSYAFPSITAFYIAVLFVTFMVISWQHNYSHGWLVYLVFFTLLIGIPFVLIYMGYNRWWEIAYSLGIGVLTSFVFIYCFQLFVVPVLPYLMHQFPLWHLGYKDTFLMDDSLQMQHEIVCRVIL